MKIKNKFIRFFIKTAICLICLFFVLLAALHFVLVYFISSDNVKNKIVSTLQEQLATEVKIGNISASLIDLSIDDIEIKIKD